MMGNFHLFAFEEPADILSYLNSLILCVILSSKPHFWCLILNMDSQWLYYNNKKYEVKPVVLE